MNELLLRRRMAENITIIDAIKLDNSTFMEDFKFTPTSNFKLELDYKLPSGTWGGIFLISPKGITDWKKYRILVIAKIDNNSSSGDTFYYNGNYKKGLSVDSTVRHILTIDNWKDYYNGVLKNDASVLKGDFMEGCILQLYKNIIIYSLKVWIDGLYVGELLPAKQNQNVGLVNKLNNKFYKLDAIEI